MLLDHNRRELLKSSTLAVTAIVAGCLGDGDSDDENGTTNGDGNGDDNDDSDDENGNTTDDGTDNENGDSDENGDSNGDGNGDDVPSEVADYLSGANLYDGFVDLTGEDEVTVMVGAEENPLAFGPPAIRVDAGTTVIWEWTGDGGGHNVVDEDGEFESDLSSQTGFTFEQTFDNSGYVLYYCEPHRSTGMRGAVIVE